MSDVLDVAVCGMGRMGRPIATRIAPVAFDLTTATKDLRLAVAASRTAHLPVSVLERTLQLHDQALEDGYGDKDMAAMASWFGVRAGDDPDDAATGRTLEGQ
jgi:3-hydroxyisobutyrate dehydrogenase-like beta-hydroxyacid dehydrogenase